MVRLVSGGAPDHNTRMEHKLAGNERLAVLLAEVSNGNEKAFSELYRLTHAYLYFRTLRLLRRPAQAEEVLQEAYLTIWSKAWRFRTERGGPMAWMIAIVHNHAVSTLRTARREQECTASASFDVVLDENGDVGEAIEEGDATTAGFAAVEHRRLRDGINQLEAAQRQSLVLAFDHGLSHVELARHLDVPLGTVKSWVRRGLARLRAILEQQPCRTNVPRHH